MIIVKTALDYIRKVLDEDIHPREVQIADEAEYAMLLTMLKDLEGVHPFTEKLHFLQGRCYNLGIGCVQDFPKAIALYEKAIEEGYTDALYNLAMCYVNEKNKCVDYDKHNSLLMKSAEYHNVYAIFSLAYEYQNGMFNKNVDIDAAKYWYQIAADLGMPEAEAYLKKLDQEKKV